MIYSFVFSPFPSLSVQFFVLASRVDQVPPFMRIVLLHRDAVVQERYPNNQDHQVPPLLLFRNSS